MSTNGGNYIIELRTGEFFYQACLGTKCFYPRAMKFKVDLDTTTLSVDRTLR